MWNHVIQNLHSNWAARIPENAGMRQQQIAGCGAVQLQIGSHGERVARIKKQHWRVILPHAILQKIVHADAEDHHLWPGSAKK